VPPAWEGRLARWVDAGLVGADAAARIREWESARDEGGVRWPVRLAIGLGALLLAAGVLLFVAAHWDRLDPASRFTLLIAAVAAFHLAGALAAERSPSLAMALHACGTIALGGGIFLTGQIFHLQEHWPGGVLLWAVGAWIGWALLRDWPQALLAALLTPAWLAGEWSLATERLHDSSVLSVGVLLLALVYLGAGDGPRGESSGIRRALVWAGGLAVIPAALLLAAGAYVGGSGRQALRTDLVAVGWIVAVGGPLAVGWMLQRRLPAMLLALGTWVAVGPAITAQGSVAPYLWTAALSLGLITWGSLEHRSERINLGVAGFALTTLVFYFSSVMDRLGRSAGLIGMGLLFLGGGWALERARRSLLARAATEGSA
jgi:uncharacterized membrane protein